MSRKTRPMSQWRPAIKENAPQKMYRKKETALRHIALNGGGKLVEVTFTNWAGRIVTLGWRIESDL